MKFNGDSFLRLLCASYGGAARSSLDDAIVRGRKAFELRRRASEPFRVLNFLNAYVVVHVALLSREVHHTGSQLFCSGFTQNLYARRPFFYNLLPFLFKENGLFLFSSAWREDADRFILIVITVGRESLALTGSSEEVPIEWKWK